MEEIYRTIHYNKTYEIKKINDDNYTVQELKELLELLIKEGRGDYKVNHEGFCCGVNCIDVSETHKEISID